MRSVVERMMEKYGMAVQLSRGTSICQVWAFFQSVRSKSWDLSESEYSPLGEIPRGRHIYIGPVEPAVSVGDTVWVDKKAYLVRRSEIVRDGSGPVYCWGLCLERGGEDQWGQS